MSPIREFAEFLAQAPPGTSELVAQVGKHERVEGMSQVRCVLSGPDTQLECDSDECGGVRTFQCSSGAGCQLHHSRPHYVFMHYSCRNCRKSLKIYSLIVDGPPQGQLDGKVTKIGEWPQFGPSTPPRFVKLIGPDRDLFFKGLRSENQGLGIGAFAYYRRVVENQKGRLLDAIINVGRKTGLVPKAIATLESAKSETQFSKAIESIKDAIPDAIRIKGRNPLTLLHAPLSEGIHDKTDEECLGLATDVREILFAMAEKIAEALREQKALDDAIKNLSQSRGKGK